jgi:1-deoxy-D-xylulose-5-phosphate reductoisomerase
MRLPILHGLAYPLRLNTEKKGLIRELSWAEVATLHFADLPMERFPCFRLALEAGKRGGTYPAALVGADEEAVALFLSGKIGFLEIPQLIEDTLERHQSIAQPDVATLLEACNWARRMVQELADARHCSLAGTR